MTDKQRNHFQQLREREAAGLPLTEADTAELVAFIQEIEQQEAAYLAPATQRIHAERLTLAEQNRTLETLAQRKEALAERLQQVLQESRAERQEINKEAARILGKPVNAAR